MAYSPIQLISTPLEDYAGYWLKFYEESTTTLLSMATDAAAGTLLAKAEISSGGTVPIGFLKTAGDALLNPFVDGDYDAWIFPTSAEADANDTTNAIQIADNLNADPQSTLAGQMDVYDSTRTYVINETALATNGSYYISLINSNLNYEPSISPTQWQLIPVKDMVGLAETQTLTSKTLTSPVLNTGVSGTAVLDEDDMSSNSATQIATQQSIKAYIDGKIASLNTKIIEIGDWNMDLNTAAPSIPAHNLTLASIRNISVLIRNDSSETQRSYDLASHTKGLTTYIRADATNIYLARDVSGFFDSTAFDETSYNRGWITIQYID